MLRVRLDSDMFRLVPPRYSAFPNYVGKYTIGTWLRSIPSIGPLPLQPWSKIRCHRQLILILLDSPLAVLLPIDMANRAADGLAALNSHDYPKAISMVLFMRLCWSPQRRLDYYLKRSMAHQRSTPPNYYGSSVRRHHGRRGRHQTCKARVDSCCSAAARNRPLRSGEICRCRLLV